MFTIIISLLIAMPPNPSIKGFVHPPKKPGRMDMGPGFIPPPPDSMKALILLVDFSDNPATYPAADFDSLIYGTGKGSMRDYYSEVSYGKFTISRSSRVIGWLRMPKTYDLYVDHDYGFGSYPNNVQGLVMDACTQADPQVNFADFDQNADGVVDAIFIVHAGPGAEENPSDSTNIWSHQWQLSDNSNGCPGPYNSADGVTVDLYSMEPELLQSASSMIYCGVFVHEFGHQLGLPDLYDRDYSTNGLGLFCLMAAGSWGGSGSTYDGSSPSHPCAWVKYQLGWTTPVAVERSGTNQIVNQSMPNAAVTSFSVRLLEDLGGPDWIETGSAGEYFLVENRFRTGFDRSLPGDGLLILHCDDRETNNDNENHPLVGIMQADGDGRFLLPNWGTAADLWKSDSTGFGDGSTPNSRDYDKNPTGALVYKISSSGSSMTASFWIAPVLFGRTAAYPNPFRIDRLPSWGRKVILQYYPTNTLGIADPTPEFKVSIFNLAGELVKVLQGSPDVISDFRSAYWDLKNGKGNEVVSGMYLYIMETTEAPIQRIVGRLTVIR